MTNDTMKSIYEQYESLLNEHAIAWDHYREAQAKCAQKFREVAAGRSRQNPSVAELEAEAHWWKAAMDLEKRIKALMESMLKSK